MLHFLYLITALYWSWLSGVALTAITPVNRDEGYAQTGIGFNFAFYNGEGGGVYTDLCANTNGYIAVPQGNTGCTTPDNTPDPIPSANSPNNYIAPLWADLSGDDNEFLYYQVTLPPLFVPIANQTQPPGCGGGGCNGRPNTLIGWTGSNLYWHRWFNNYETIYAITQQILTMLYILMMSFPLISRSTRRQQIRGFV
jgi:hypothetical protein